MPKVKSEPKHLEAASHEKPYSSTPFASGWTQKDRSLLYQYVLFNKPGEWGKAAESVPGKTAKQVSYLYIELAGVSIADVISVEIIGCELPFCFEVLRLDSV